MNNNSVFERGANATISERKLPVADEAGANHVGVAREAVVDLRRVVEGCFPLPVEAPAEAASVVAENEGSDPVDELARRRAAVEAALGMNGYDQKAA